jgi:hypothetical protein
MTPAQHLSTARGELKSGATDEQITDGRKHIDALHGTPLNNQGIALINNYEAAKRKADKAQAAIWEAQTKKDVAADSRESKIWRGADIRCYLPFPVASPAIMFSTVCLAWLSIGLPATTWSPAKRSRWPVSREAKTPVNAGIGGATLRSTATGAFGSLYPQDS